MSSPDTAPSASHGRRRWIVALLSPLVLLLVDGTALAAGSSGAITVGDVVCTGYADSPHRSDGAGGFIGKARWSCNQPSSVTYTLTLYSCAVPPTLDEGYLQKNCFLRGTSSDTIAVGGDLATRYVPPLGTPGAPQCRYCTLANRWTISNLSGELILYAT